MTTTTLVEMRTIHCATCGVTRDVKPTAKGNPRPPRGWKNVDGVLTCAACWGKTYRIAAVTIPVASADWEALRPALRSAQEAVTALSNWAVRRLLQNDVVRGPGEAKLSPMPAIYLYGEAAEHHAWAGIGKGTGAAVLTAVEQRYRGMRYDVIWRSAASPPAYRFPQPVPLRPDGYRVDIKDERVVVNVALNGARHDLTLSGGHRFRRQRRSIEWWIAHPELLAQAALIEQDGHPGDHRPANDKRDNGNGGRRAKRLMLKIVGWLPIKAESIPDNTLSVHTDRGSLLVAVDHDGERVWTYHADHARRIAMRHASHLSRLARLSDDRKAETRSPKREGAALRDMIREASEKDRRRLNDLCHVVSASVVNFAARRKVAELRYDDSAHGFCESFPWSMLKTMIEQKARAKGIHWISSDPVPEKTPEPLATEQEQ